MIVNGKLVVHHVKTPLALFRMDSFGRILSVVYTPVPAVFGPLKFVCESVTTVVPRVESSGKRSFCERVSDVESYVKEMPVMIKKEEEETPFSIAQKERGNKTMCERFGFGQYKDNVSLFDNIPSRFLDVPGYYKGHSSNKNYGIDYSGSSADMTYDLKKKKFFKCVAPGTYQDRITGRIAFASDKISFSCVDRLNNEPGFNIIKDNEDFVLNYDTVVVNKYLHYLTLCKFNSIALYEYYFRFLPTILQFRERLLRIRCLGDFKKLYLWCEDRALLSFAESVFEKCYSSWSFECGFVLVPRFQTLLTFGLYESENGDSLWLQYVYNIRDLRACSLVSRRFYRQVKFNYNSRFVMMLVQYRCRPSEYEVYRSDFSEVLKLILPLWDDSCLRGPDRLCFHGKIECPYCDDFIEYDRSPLRALTRGVAKAIPNKAFYSFYAYYSLVHLRQVSYSLVTSFFRIFEVATETHLCTFLEALGYKSGLYEFVRKGFLCRFVLTGLAGYDCNKAGDPLFFSKKIDTLNSWYDKRSITHMTGSVLL